MMARSTTRSNQRPDTLMQDRSPPARQNPLATHGRTIHLGHSRPTHSAPVPINVRYASNSDHSRHESELTRSVESRCGAVALGRTYLLPPLSSGGALMVPPWLRFH